MPTQQLVCIYSGEGATTPPFEALEQSGAIADHTRLVYVTSQHIHDGFLSNQRNIKAFVMPGNRSAARYLEALGRSGVEAVRTYVAHGGTYIGICAGAYMAASRSTYSSPPGTTPLCRTVAKDNLFGFFRGTCHGTLPHPDYVYVPGNGWKNAIPVHVRSAIDNALTGTINWGGPYYVPTDGELVTCLATYDPQSNHLPREEIAIAATRYGLGRALLSGVHLEITPDYMHSATAMDRDRDDGTRRALLAAQLNFAPESRNRLMGAVFSFLKPPSPK